MVIVKRKELSLSERMYLPEIGRGLGVTLKKMLGRKTTRQYPEDPLIKTAVTRGQPRLAVNEDGTLRCVSCGMCEATCPAYAITIDGQETERETEREPRRFEIDFLRCILCGLCEEACPKGAIWMSDELELANLTRKSFVLDLDHLKRPLSVLRGRIDYVKKINDRWRTSSSTS